MAKMRPEDDDSRNYVTYSVIKNGQEQHEPEKKDYSDSVPTIGVRHCQCFLLFLLLFLAFGCRVNLSVAIVAMMDPAANANPDIPAYPEWTQKGPILSAFFWGYIWPQVFAGYAANRFGAKWFLVGFSGVQSVVVLLTPVIAAYFGEVGVMAGRAVQGFCQGFFIPVMTHLLSQWAPQEERSRLTNLAFGAVPLGTVVGMLVTGLIASTWYGWTMVFYLYGTLGLAVSLLFALLGYDSPAVHPSISEAEKYYIEKSLGHVDEKPTHKVPWKSVLASGPLWALVATQCGYVFGFWVLLSQIPSYMNYVLHFNIKDNSILSALPYFVLFLLSLLTSFLSDYVINKGMLTRGASRKLFNSLGLALPSAALVMMGYVKSDEATKAVWLLIAAIGLGALTTSGGWMLNHMDLSPNFAGTLMGLCNGLSNCFSIVAPLAVQYFVKDERDPVQWRIIFFMAAGFQVITGTIFVLFGSATVQPWNDYDSARNEEDEKDKPSKSP